MVHYRLQVSFMLRHASAEYLPRFRHAKQCSLVFKFAPTTGVLATPIVGCLLRIPTVGMTRNYTSLSRLCFSLVGVTASKDRCNSLR